MEMSFSSTSLPTFNFICIVTVNTEQEQNLLTQLYFTPLVQQQHACIGRQTM